MSSIVASLLPKTAAQARASIAAVFGHCDLIEIRADYLSRDALREIVGVCQRETIVTVRRVADGGQFGGTEAEREALLRAALEAGARWVDVEDEGTFASWADGPDAARIILSRHAVDCTSEALQAARARMGATRAGRLKIVATTDSVEDVVTLRDFLRTAKDDRLCAFGLGVAAATSRIFALAWGSWGTYGAVGRGAETAAGQFSVAELDAVYRVRELSAATQVATLLGTGILPASPSPAMHNAGYRAAGLDRVYVPLQSTQWAAAWNACARLGWSDLAFTLPFKTAAAAAAETRDDISEAARAVNTMVAGQGSNTDGPAAVESLERCGLSAGDRVDLLGAGGTARAIAVALARAGYGATLWSRSGKVLTPAAGVGVGRLAERSPGAADWLINATPLVDESLLGDGPPARKGVLEVVYGRTPSALLKRASEHGLESVNGLELLVAQAERQFFLHTGQLPTPGIFAAAGQRYLSSLG